MLPTLIKATPVIGQGYGLIKTSIRVYNTTSPIGICTELGKSLMEECLPPQIVMPAKCLVFFTQCGITLASPNSFSAGLALGTLRQIID